MMLNTLAQRVVTELRQAQTYALGNVSRTATTFFPYGVYFDASENDTLRFFVDLNSNGKYQPNELVETIKLNPGNTISKLCVNMEKEVKTIANCTSVSKLNVVFTRPYPEPMLDSTPPNPPYGDAEIILSSDNGATKTVIVWMTGQLAIE